MVDHAMWSAAAAEAIGYGAVSYWAACEANADRQVTEVVDADAVAGAIRTFASTEAPWSGTATELLRFLNDSRGDRTAEAGWPRRAADLGRRLNVVGPALRELGIDVRQERQGKARQRLWQITTVDQATNAVRAVRLEDAPTVNRADGIGNGNHPADGAARSGHLADATADSTSPRADGANGNGSLPEWDELWDLPPSETTINQRETK
jgi:hypothetical protein